MTDSEAISYIRDPNEEDSARVTFVELFFDLVFVFAITQLAYYLLHHLTAEGLVRAALAFAAVWWLWVSCAWATNRLDPDRSLVRIVLFALMMASLLLSTALPEAFDSRGLGFALTYVAANIGRSLFMARAMRLDAPEHRLTFVRISLWFAASGVLWTLGAVLKADARVVTWLLALAVDLIGPWAGYRFPGLGRSEAAEWDIEGAHLAERCALFVIIALGESLLATGASLGQLSWTAGPLAAFGLAFLGAVAMWWVYFDSGFARGEKAITRSTRPGLLARLVYLYVHAIIVAGIVLAAVGDKLVLGVPEDAAPWAAPAMLIGGPALFLFGNLVFKASISRRPPLSHVAGLALLALLAPAAARLSPLALSAATTVVLTLVAWLERRFLTSAARHA